MNKRKQNVFSSFCRSLYLSVWVHSLFNCWFVYSNVATHDMIWGSCDTTCSPLCPSFLPNITRRIVQEIFPANNIFPELRKWSSYINNLFLLCVSQPSAELSVPETTRIKRGRYFPERSDGRPRLRPPRLPPRIIALVNMRRRLFSSRLHKAESSAFGFFFFFISPPTLCQAQQEPSVIQM